MTIPEIRKLGGHQGEPGHALTGTTPLHAVLDLPEIPALVYVSEILITWMVIHIFMAEDIIDEGILKMSKSWMKIMSFSM